MKKMVLRAVCLSVLLAACSSESDNSADTRAQEALALCRHAAVLPDIRDNIRQAVRAEAQAFAAQDSRNFVDADKVTAAADRLQVRMDAVRAENKGCAANISVIVPQTVLDTAETNAPLLNMASPAESILLRSTESSLNFDGQAVLGQLRYKVEARPFAVHYREALPAQIGSLLAAALLPYGVKDMVLLNGRAVRREEALLGLGRTDTPRAPQETDTLAERREKARAQQAAQAAAEETPAPAVPPPELPETATDEGDSEQARQLEAVRTVHQNADRDIKSAWKRIDPSIQKDLVDEQRDWEKDKNRRCREEAADEQSYMQCDVRETRKRINYLDGYSIP